jgi:hypothetical protein
MWDWSKNDSKYSIKCKYDNPKKAFEWISHNFESDSNVIDPNDLPDEKHISQSISIDVERWIDIKLFLTNVDLLIRCNCESDSNIIDTNNLQFEK